MFVKRENGNITATYRWANPQAIEELPDDHEDIAAFKDARRARREAPAALEEDRSVQLEARILALELQLAALKP